MFVLKKIWQKKFTKHCHTYIDGFETFRTQIYAKFKADFLYSYLNQQNLCVLKWMRLEYSIFFRVDKVVGWKEENYCHHNCAWCSFVYRICVTLDWPVQQLIPHYFLYYAKQMNFAYYLYCCKEYLKSQEWPLSQIIDDINNKL